MLVLHVCGRFLGLLKVLYGFGWFWPVIYCNGCYWHDLWIDFRRSALILILHDGYGPFYTIFEK